MQRVVPAKAVFFPLICLLFLNLLLAGCTAELFRSKLGAAEDKISSGKPMSKDLTVTPPILPPSIAARHKVALAINSMMNGEYNYKELSNTLADIRKDPVVPRYLKVEAGYILVLLERMEDLDKSNEKNAKGYKECQRENTALKKELDELKFTLEKIEEIHIDVEKRRGQQ